MALNQPYLIFTVTGVVLILTVLYFASSRKTGAAEKSSSVARPPHAATLQVCAALTSKFPSIVHGRENDELWNFIRSYWATQAQIPKPALLVRPQSATQVSEVMKILNRHIQQCSGDEPIHFAIRSGGHSPNEGFASADAGIVLDLSLLKGITLSADRKLVDIGPGATWGTVYSTLETYGLAVAGGRASTVGVGGLTLGGGLSFFSPQVGFVCDAIVSFEIVLSDGRIITASEESEHADLAVALRGGGNNFGVVTKFTARTFPQTDVWMGYCFHYPSATERLLKGFYDFGKAEGFDKKATCMLIFSWTWWLPFTLPISCINYTEPTPHPPALRQFSKEKRFWGSLSVRSLAKATDVVEGMTAWSKQNLFHTTTFENDLETLHEARAAFQDSLSSIQKVTGVVWSLVIQPLVPSATLHHAFNAMGIDTDKTLTIMHISIVWNDAKDDIVIHKTAEDLVDRVEAFARRRGVYHPYKYSNYCSVSQNPYVGYGLDRQKFLRDVSRKYDPRGVFQSNVPGGHKVFAE